MSVNIAIGPYAEEVSFSWGDAPTKIYTAAPGKMIYSVRTIITEGLDGTDPALCVGDSSDHDRLLSSYIMDITVPGTNEVFPNYAYGVATEIYFYVTPGAGGFHGTGRIIITHQN